MIVKEVISKVGKDSFFKVRDLSEFFNLQTEDARKILLEGKERNILIETIEDEFVFKEDLEESKLKDFSEWIEKNFVLSSLKDTKLSFDETQLKDKVLHYLILRNQEDASEFLVKHLEKNNHIYSTRDDKQSEIWIYKEGVYVPQGESHIREFVRKITGKSYTTTFSNKVIEKIREDTKIEPEEFFNKNYIEEIPVENGILNIKTKELSIFNPKKIFFNKLPVVYDPSAKCPRIEDHFKTILKEEEDAKVMFEYFGYLLLKENKFEKAFMFLGNGRNGKSKTLELIKKFVGIENTSALSLNSMHPDSFSLSDLFGKLVNLAGDLNYTDLQETGTLKQLVGRDEIQAKRKYLTDLKFVNYSKLTFACNELPKIYDLTDGFWTKWILLEFPYKFISQKEYNELPEEQRRNKKIMNPDIIEQITTPEELSGLLNKALESLEKILIEKEFSYSKGTNEVKNTWVRQSDSFTAFCMDCLEEDFENKIVKQKLKKFYLDYCRKHRLRSASDKSIKITLENNFGVVEHFDGVVRSWVGVKLKEELTGLT